MGRSRIGGDDVGECSLVPPSSLLGQLSKLLQLAWGCSSVDVSFSVLVLQPVLLL